MLDFLIWTFPQENLYKIKRGNAMQLSKNNSETIIYFLFLSLFPVLQPLTLKSQSLNNNRVIKLSSNGTLEIKNIDVNSNRIGLYEKFEITLDFDDGTPFFGVGMDREQGNTYPNEQIYCCFANTGGNFNRLFLTNGTLNLGEINPNNPQPDRGIGKINLEGTWHLDQVMEAGERQGIYHMLSLTNQWTFNQRWKNHFTEDREKMQFRMMEKNKSYYY